MIPSVEDFFVKLLILSPISIMMYEIQDDEEHLTPFLRKNDHFGDDDSLVEIVSVIDDEEKNVLIR
jgi:hypothetical protein